MLRARLEVNCVLPLMLLPFCVIQEATPQSCSTTLPRFVDFTLAGARLTLSQQEFHKFDRGKGYHLFGVHKGNYKYLSLTLARSGKGSTKAPQNMKIASLRTGRGVSIGDTPRQVRAKLGNPDKEHSDQDWDNDRHEDLIFMYTATIPVALPGSDKKVEREYMGAYIFYKNRLKLITFQLFVMPPAPLPPQRKLSHPLHYHSL